MVAVVVVVVVVVMAMIALVQRATVLVDYGIASDSFFLLRFQV